MRYGDGKNHDLKEKGINKIDYTNITNLIRRGLTIQLNKTV